MLKKRYTIHIYEACEEGDITNNYHGFWDWQTEAAKKEAAELKKAMITPTPFPTETPFPTSTRMPIPTMKISSPSATLAPVATVSATISSTVKPSATPTIAP